MSSQLIDPTTYPISTATAEALRRPLFGHVIDGELVPSARRRARCRSSTPPRASRSRTAAAGSADDVERAVALGARARSTTAAGAPAAAREGAPPAPPRRRCSPSAATLFGELDVLDAGLLRRYTDVHRPASRRRRIEYYAGWPSKLEGTIPRRGRGVRRLPRSASRSASSASSCPGTARPSCFAFVAAALGAPATGSCSSPPSRRRWPRC